MQPERPESVATALLGPSPGIIEAIAPSDSNMFVVTLCDGNCPSKWMICHEI